MNFFPALRLKMIEDLEVDLAEEWRDHIAHSIFITTEASSFTSHLKLA